MGIFTKHSLRVMIMAFVFISAVGGIYKAALATDYIIPMSYNKGNKSWSILLQHECTANNADQAKNPSYHHWIPFTEKNWITVKDLVKAKIYSGFPVTAAVESKSSKSAVFYFLPVEFIRGTIIEEKVRLGFASLYYTDPFTGTVVTDPFTGTFVRPNFGVSDVYAWLSADKVAETVVGNAIGVEGCNPECQKYWLGGFAPYFTKAWAILKADDGTYASASGQSFEGVLSFFENEYYK